MLQQHVGSMAAGCHQLELYADVVPGRQTPRHPLVQTGKNYGHDGPLSASVVRLGVAANVLARPAWNRVVTEPEGVAQFVGSHVHQLIQTVEAIDPYLASD